MLDHLIHTHRAKTVDSIQAHYSDRYLPEVILVPGARFGIYALAKEMLSPRDRVAVSPITCHSVIEALLAAGVIPIFVDIEPETGNIDVARLYPLLKSVRAVVTTNLYGNPDRVVEIRKHAVKHGVWLIEDCAHVLCSRIDGRRIGTVGDASVFSFKKYFGEHGGVLTVSDRQLATRIRERVSRQSRPPASGEDTLRLIQHALHRSMPRSARWASVTYQWACATSPRPTVSENPGSSFLGYFASAEQPATASLLRTSHLLAQEDSMIAERARRTLEIAESSSCQLKANRDADEICYFVAPCFCSKRDEIIQALKARGLPTYFLYPPLNRVFPDLAKASSLNLDLIEEWSRKILPVNLDFAGEFVRAARACCEVK